MTGQHRALMPPPHTVRAEFTYLAEDPSPLGLHAELWQFLRQRADALPDRWDTTPIGRQRIPGRRWGRRPAFRVVLTRQTHRLPEALATAKCWRTFATDVTVGQS